MNACQECEDGRCPCGTGCPGCVFTGQCAACNGTEAQERPAPARDLRFGNRRVLRPVKPVCATCGRHGYVRLQRPDFDHLRASSPGNYKREMRARRCTGCHRRFTGAKPRTPNYALQEAM